LKKKLPQAKYIARSAGMPSRRNNELWFVVRLNGFNNYNSTNLTIFLRTW